MNEILTRQFERIGALLKLEEPDERLLARDPQYHHVDVRQEKRGETFIISCRPSRFRLQVLQADAQESHLLLMMQNSKSGEIHKYLCGHDERHWFAAAIPEEARAKNIREAKVEEAAEAAGERIAITFDSTNETIYQLADSAGNDNLRTWLRNEQKSDCEQIRRRIEELCFQ